MSIRIVSPEDLGAVRSDRRSDATIVDARRHTAFAAGHIPGAVWMGWEQWCEPAPSHADPVLRQEGYWGVLAPVDEISCARQLSELGLRDDRSIVVYADGPRTRGREGRIAWTLCYFGAADVSLLDGGWHAWVEAGGRAETETVPPVPGHFTVRLQSQRRCMLEDLRLAERAGTLPRLVDTRSAAEFAGEIQAYLPRRGHLPGAQLVPFADLFESDGRYAGRDRFLAMLPDSVREETPMVAYCEVGVRASLFAMLHEAYTERVVPLYDGSLIEWSLNADLPLEGGARTPEAVDG